MRLSVKKSDPGYRPDAHQYKPYLNGVLVKNCFTADEDRGYVLVYKTDENGNYLLNELRTEILTKKLFGKVELIKIGYFPGPQFSTQSCPCCLKSD